MSSADAVGIGRLYGVGVGPGDPELLTLKAARIIDTADVVAYFAKEGRRSNARAVVADRLGRQQEVTLAYPVTTEIHRHDPAYRNAIATFYEDSAARLAALLDAGLTVAVLSEGDPLFYCSYMHLHCRLAGRYPTEVIAGVTGMSGSWSTAGVPIAQGDDILMVLPGTLDEAELAERFASADAAVVMKLGRALYVERATTASASILTLTDKTDDDAPYFSIVLVPGWDEKP